MNLNDCYNYNDFRKLAKKNLPAPIFHYIDGGSDDETTLKRNTESFLKCDLVPNILASVGQPDLSTTVLGQKIDFPLFLSPTSMNRLYHHNGEKGTAKAAKKIDAIIASQVVLHKTKKMGLLIIKDGEETSGVNNWKYRKWFGENCIIKKILWVHIGFLSAVIVDMFSSQVNGVEIVHSVHQ